MQMNVSVIGEPTFHPTYPVAVVVNQRVEKSPSRHWTPVFPPRNCHVDLSAGVDPKAR